MDNYKLQPASAVFQRKSNHYHRGHFQYRERTLVGSERYNLFHSVGTRRTLEAPQRCHCSYRGVASERSGSGSPYPQRLFRGTLIVYRSGTSRLRLRQFEARGHSRGCSLSSFCVGNDPTVRRDPSEYRFQFPTCHQCNHAGATKRQQRLAHRSGSDQIRFFHRPIQLLRFGTA